MAVPFVLSVSFLAQFVSVWFKRRETAVLLFIADSLPLFFMVGVSWPVEAIPDVIRAASRVFPSTSAIDGLVRINQMGASLHDVSRDWIDSLAIDRASTVCSPCSAARCFADGRPAMAGSLSIRRVGLLVAIVVPARLGFSSIAHGQQTRRSAVSSWESFTRPKSASRPKQAAGLQSVQVKAGQQVHKGDVLAVLEQPRS